MQPLYITYMNRFDIEELKLTDQEIIAAIETALAVQGRGEAVIEPRVHLEPKVANERDDETILFRHHGLSLSDIALGHAMLEKGQRLGIGQRLRFA